MNTSLLQKITVDSVLRALDAHKYPINLGAYYLTPFGVRANTGVTNLFDDAIGGLYRDAQDQWKVVVFPGTTDPGLYYLENPMNVDGTAIMVPGYYPQCYALGRHRGVHPAFVQVGPMMFYRDRDKDKTYDLDPNTIEKDIIGANIHRASATGTSTYVDKWSAGCQVLANTDNCDALIALGKEHIRVYPNLFDYALLEEKDFPTV